MNSKTTFYIVCLVIFYLLVSAFQKLRLLQMDTYLQKVEDMFNSGDPIIRNWFLVRHNFLPFILCGCYAILAWRIGPALMRKRKPFELRTAMVVFNFLLVIVYTVALLVAIWLFPKLPREIFCNGFIGLDKGHVAYKLARAGWVVYILKYIEFLDTVFFILRKKEKQITFLHVVHHTFVPICGWIIFRTERSGMQSVPGIINAVVHVIMYSYYGLAAMGPGVRKYLWWKKYLTQLQMIQFCLVLLYIGVVAPLSGCTMFLSSYIMDFVIASLFLYLFYKFYKSSFHNKTKSVEINRNVKNGSSTSDIYTTVGNKTDISTNSTLQKQD